MNIKKIALSVVCALSLAACVALVGCGGGNNDQYIENFTGSYTATELTQDGSAMNLEQYKSYGIEVTLELKSDKTVTLDMMGEAMEGTWNPTGEATIDLDFGEDGVGSGELQGDELHMEEGSTSMVFTKSAQ